MLHIGERRLDTARLELISYTAGTGRTPRRPRPPMPVWRLAGSPGLHWVNLLGIHDVPLVEQLGTGFGLNSLALEDLLNTDHRPKAENFGDSLLVILKILSFDRDG
ncbi:MAG: hypothetical protein MZW92_49335 [Comamonadaceae bacterium]|nr:hypothetical protein [Comamonadaceae bacterium]